MSARATRSPFQRAVQRAERSLLIGLVRRLLVRARPLVRLAGVDVRAFEAIVETRVLLDLNASPLGTQASVNVGPHLIVGMFWIMGVFLGAAAFAGMSPALWSSVTVGVLMGMLGMMILLLYGHVMVDPTDVEVLAPHPVSDRTLYASRIGTLAVYVVVLTFSFGVLPVFLASFCYPLPATLLALPLALVSGAGWAVGGVALGYALLLRLVGPARFDRATLFVQIAGVALMMSLGTLVQLASRNLQSSWADLEGLPERWVLLLPPRHAGALFDIGAGDFAAENFALAALAFALPLLALLGSAALASRYFVAAIRGEFTRARKRAPSWAAGRGRALAEWITRDAEERAGFHYGWSLCVRDKLFVRQAWPAMAAVIVPVLGAGFSLTELGEHAGPIVLACLPLVLGFFSLFADVSRTTTDEGARWVFLAWPLERPERFLRGALEAIAVRLAFPVAAVLLILQLGLGDLRVYALAPFSWAAGIGLLLWVVPRMELALPFTEHPVVGEMRLANLAVTLVMMLLTGVLLAVVVGLYFLDLLPVTLVSALLPLGLWWPLARRFENVRVQPPKPL